MKRKMIPFRWEGRDLEIAPTPALIVRIEDRENGLSIIDAADSNRITDRAWIVFCGLVEAGAVGPGDYERVLGDAMDRLAEYTTAAGSVIVELVMPDAASEIDAPEGAAGNGDGATGE